MDFELDEEESLLRDTVRELCDQQIRPHAQDWDGQRAVPDALWTELSQMGLLALEVDEAQGGAGLSAVAASALCEELAAADGAIALTIAAHNHLGLGHALAGLPAEAPERASLLSDGRLVAWAVPEAAREPGFSGEFPVRGRQDGDDWVLEGSVELVLGAARAGAMVLVGQTEAGPSAWLVDGEAEGVEREPVRTLGARAAGTARVVLTGTRVPSSRCLGAPGEARAQIEGVLPRFDLAEAAIACGLARGALQVSTAYAQERQQFGRPIARFQAIQWKLADMGTSLDAAWLLTAKAAWAFDAGRPADEAAAAAARARLFAGSMATRACSEALQIHGGYGYTREYPVERALRDSRQLRSRNAAAMQLRIAQTLESRFAG